MTERCTNCGSELFAGQQFCRRCGARTLSLEGEAPTQILTDTAPPPSAAGTTALPPQRGTGEAMWGPRHTGPQAPFANFAHTSPLPATTAAPQGTTMALPPTKKKRRWLVPALLGLLLLAAVGGVLAVAMFYAIPRKVVIVDRGGPPPPPPVPGMAEAGESVLDDTGALVTADETVLTKTFELSGDDATFSLKNTQGDILVESWDEDRVELKVTKRGGSAAERQNARVTLRQTDDALELAAGNSPIKTFFEVKLPRSMGKVELSSRSGDVKVTQLRSPLSVSLQNGDIELDDVRGPVEAKLINGDIEVVYRGNEREGAHEFTNVNGDVVVRLAEGMDADLKATIVNGSIDVDSRLGFQAQKKQPGWYVDKRLGDGGEPVTIKSVNGSIKFKK